MSDDDLRNKLKPYLSKKLEPNDTIIDEFLQQVFYRSGKYQGQGSHVYMAIVGSGERQGSPCFLANIVVVNVGHALSTESSCLGYSVFVWNFLESKLGISPRDTMSATKCSQRVGHGGKERKSSEVRFTRLRIPA